MSDWNTGLEELEGPEFLQRNNELDAKILEQEKKIKANCHAPEELPPLEIKAADPPATARALAEIIARGDTFLFNGNGIVHVVVESDGMPQAIEVSSEVVRAFGHKICRPFRWVKRAGELVEVPAAIPHDVASIYLNGLRGEWQLKHFKGITTAPILLDGGKIRYATGFDQATGLYCHNVPEIDLPEKPTDDDARRALHLLRHFFRTFPYADSVRVDEIDRGIKISVVDLTKPPGLDESAALTAMMTAACRQCLNLAPGALFSAPLNSGAGTGKGLIVRAICIIASGASPAAFTPGHDGNELDKRLNSALIKARPTVFLDNVNDTAIKSDSLASALTENPSETRLFGITGLVPLYVQTFIAITGNGIAITEDLCRRLLNANFDAKCENPELREFHDDFLDTVFARRADLLAALLTIWRWGQQQRDLPKGKPLGSYDVWRRWCRDPLLALGCRDVADRTVELKAADPKRREMAEFFETWWSSLADQEVKTTDLPTPVIELIQGAFGKDGNRNAQKINGFVERAVGPRVGGFVLQRIRDETYTRPRVSYHLLQTGE
jgi:hypothetical protein